MNKALLIASFVKPTNLQSYLEYLSVEHDLPKNKIFIFLNKDTGELILTFKITLDPGERINIRKEFPNSIPIHKKGNAIYTINALNKLIEHETGLDKGNIDYKSHKIDWDEYQNKIILNRGDELIINSIEKLNL
jgi:hypothetical protein